MKRDKDPYMRDYELKQQGEPTLRYMAEMFAKRAAEMSRRRPLRALTRVGASRRPMPAGQRRRHGVMLARRNDRHCGMARQRNDVVWLA